MSNSELHFAKFIKELPTILDEKKHLFTAAAKNHEEGERLFKESKYRARAMAETFNAILITEHHLANETFSQNTANTVTSKLQSFQSFIDNFERKMDLILKHGGISILAAYYYQIGGYKWKWEPLEMKLYWVWPGKKIDTDIFVRRYNSALEASNSDRLWDAIRFYRHKHAFTVKARNYDEAYKTAEIKRKQLQAPLIRQSNALLLEFGKQFDDIEDFCRKTLKSHDISTPNLMNNRASLYQVMRKLIYN